MEWRGDLLNVLEEIRKLNSGVFVVSSNSKKIVESVKRVKRKLIITNSLSLTFSLTTAPTDTHTNTEKLNKNTKIMEFCHIRPLCTACVCGDGKTKSIALAAIERFVATGLLSSKSNMKNEEDLKMLIMSVCAASSKEEIGVQSIKTINTLSLSNILLVKGPMMMKLLESCVRLPGKIKKISYDVLEQIVCVMLQRAQRDPENIPHVMLMIETLSSLVRDNLDRVCDLRVVLDEISSEIVKENETLS